MDTRCFGDAGEHLQSRLKAMTEGLVCSSRGGVSVPAFRGSCSTVTSVADDGLGGGGKRLRPQGGFFIAFMQWVNRSPARKQIYNVALVIAAIVIIPLAVIGAALSRSSGITGTLRNDDGLSAGDVVFVIVLMVGAVGIAALVRSRRRR